MPVKWRMGNQGLKTGALSRIHKRPNRTVRGDHVQALTSIGELPGRRISNLSHHVQGKSNIETQLVKLEVRESQAHCACIQEELDGNPWYHDILRYVKD